MRMVESRIDSLKRKRRLPVDVCCTPVFHKIWRYRTRSGLHKIVWSSLKDIYICSGCKMWSAYKDSFNLVCPKRERRKRDRRKVA